MTADIVHLTTQILIATTYNPTGWCYLVWVDRHRDLPASIVLLSGFVLTVGFIEYSRKAYGAVGWQGIGGLFIFFSTILWTLSDYDLFDLDRNETAIFSQTGESCQRSKRQSGLFPEVRCAWLEGPLRDFAAVPV